MAASNSPRRTSLRSTTSKPLAFKASRAAAAEAVHLASGGRLAYCALEMIRAVRSGCDCAGLMFQQRPEKPSRTGTRQARIGRTPSGQVFPRIECIRKGDACKSHAEDIKLPQASS